MSKSVPLPDWAAIHYSPPPSLYVLRKWVREGQIYPPPEKVGKAYYVRPEARRHVATGSLVDRL